MASPRPTVYLFDIDGTLILTGGVGRRSMEAAFVELYGAAGRQALAFPFAGMTDRAIVRTGIGACRGDSGAELAVDDAAIEELIATYLGHLAREMTRADAYRVLPGASDIVAWVRRLDGVAVGLGTGNVRKGAFAKLARGALDASFTFGGFGCDAEDRTELLRIGAERGAAALGVDMSACRIVVIGDTPKDIRAAHGLGAECIAVGTGGFAPAALLELGARAAFATLEEDGVREALLGAP